MKKSISPYLDLLNKTIAHISLDLYLSILFWWRYCKLEKKKKETSSLYCFHRSNKIDFYMLIDLSSSNLVKDTF